jgi:O-antigen/teichoic acid export membrane protein
MCSESAELLGQKVCSPTLRVLQKAIQRQGWTTIGFALAKSSMFFAPILLAQSIGVHDYGSFEYALAIASVCSMLLGLGLAGSIPYFLLHRKKVQYALVFRFHLLIMGVLQIAGSIAYAFGVLPLNHYLPLTIVTVLVVQTLDATVHKVHGRLVISSFYDSGMYILLFVVVVIARLAGIPPSLPQLALILSMYVLALVSVHLQPLIRGWSWRYDPRRYFKALKFGLPLIGATALMGLLASSGRILSARFLDMESVGEYSFFFRLAGAVLVLHQLVTTVFFRELYTADRDHLDGYLAVILVCILACSLTGYLILPFLLAPFFGILRNLQVTGMPLYYLLCFHVVLWIAMALAELLTTREALASRTLWLLAAANAIFTLGALAMHVAGVLTLIRLAQLHLLIVFAVVMGQLGLLQTKGIKLRRFASVAASSVLIYFGTALFLFP